MKVRKGTRAYREQRKQAGQRAAQAVAEKANTAHSWWTRYGGSLEPCGIVTLDDLRRAIGPSALDHCGTVRGPLTSEGEGPKVAA